VAPDGGQIYLDDEDITSLPIFERARRGLNYLPQDPSLFRTLTVEQNILLMLQASKHNAEQLEQSTDLLLRFFKLEHLRHVSAAKLSGGESRRCEIARTLATRPSFILFDEPFAKLDPIAIQDLRGLIRSLAEMDIGILITDHNLAETLISVDRAYIINSGRLLTEGTPEAIEHHPEFRRVYYD
jgi:lipopolysaccharide export system ATP-binding protein